MPKEWGQPNEAVLQLVGRDNRTRALVRYGRTPPDWSESEGGLRSSHTGCCTPSNPTEANAPFPMARTGAAWSGEWSGGPSALVLWPVRLARQ
jgi:hypothetical protein